MIFGRRRTTALLATLLVVQSAVSGFFLAYKAIWGPETITAWFTSATAIYPGDDVRIAGVRVGSITDIRPRGTRTAIDMHIDHGIALPADAKAVIVAQNLVAARYVQLAPAYHGGGPTLPDHAVIPVERTAVPVEWDDVKAQLMRLATDLGPKSGVDGTSVSRLIDSAANAMGGSNGDKLRETLSQLSAVGRILADGSSDIVATLKNLQTFISVLRDSNVQIVAFQDRLATLSSVLDDSRSDLDAALKNLAVALGEVQRFVAGSRDQTAEQIRRLANVAQVLADHRIDVENILHTAPNGVANGYNIYNPDTGDAVGEFAFANFANPVQLICGAIGAIENVTAGETGKLCAQYLGPALRLLNFNNWPFPVNPFLAKSASPGNIIYTDPALAPGGGPIPTPPDPQPVISAYTGLNHDVAPPPGYGPAPAPPPVSLPDLLLPPQDTPSPVSSAQPSADQDGPPAS